MKTTRLWKVLTGAALVAGNLLLAATLAQPASGAAAGLIKCQGAAYNCGCFEGSCMGQWPQGEQCELSVPDCSE